MNSPNAVDSVKNQIRILEYKIKDRSRRNVLKGDIDTKEEINNPTDTVTVDVPLLIRIMEYAKELSHYHVCREQPLL